MTDQLKLKTVALLGLMGFMVADAKWLGMWSLYHLSALSWPFFAGAILMGLYYLAGLFKRPAVPSPSYFEELLDRRPSLPIGNGPTGMILTIAGFLVFYSVRLRFFAPPPAGMGDSLHLLVHLPVFSHLFGYLDSFDELLDLYIHSRLYLFLEAIHAGGVEQSYAILSSLTGGLYLVLVWLFLRGRSIREILIGIALIVFTPALQLYAGYAESYTFASFHLAGILMAGALLLEEKPSFSERGETLLFMALGLFAALGALDHLIVGLSAPALAYLVWIRSGRKIDRFWRLTLYAAGPALLLMAAVWIRFLFLDPYPVSPASSFAFRPAIYPPDRFFSSRHALDMINLLVMGSPTLLLILISWIPEKFRVVRGREETFEEEVLREISVMESFVSTPERIFLLIASATYLLHATLWNPMNGFPSDWDLFTFFQIPVNLYLFYLVRQVSPRHGKKIRPALPFLLVLFLFSALFTFSWIGKNATETWESVRNKKEAALLSQEILDRIHETAFYPKIPGATRKRLYVQALLFSVQAHHKLKERYDGDAEGIRRELDLSMEELGRVVLLPENQYRREFPGVWKRLTVLNERLSKLTDERTP